MERVLMLLLSVGVFTVYGKPVEYNDDVRERGEMHKKLSFDETFQLTKLVESIKNEMKDVAKTLKDVELTPKFHEDSPEEAEKETTKKKDFSANEGFFHDDVVEDDSKFNADAVDDEKKSEITDDNAEFYDEENKLDKDALMGKFEDMKDEVRDITKTWKDMKSVEDMETVPEQKEEKDKTATEDIEKDEEKTDDSAVFYDEENKLDKDALMGELEDMTDEVSDIVGKMKDIKAASEDIKGSDELETLQDTKSSEFAKMSASEFAKISEDEKIPEDKKTWKDIENDEEKTDDSAVKSEITDDNAVFYDEENKLDKDALMVKLEDMKDDVRDIIGEMKEIKASIK